MKKSKIKFVKAEKIVDSRGNWTLEVSLVTEKGIFKDSAPSGASKGKYEAPTVSPERAIKNINKFIGPKLKGKDPTQQREIDDFLESEKFGANATTPISMAICQAAALTKNLPLYQYIREIYRGQTSAKFAEVCPLLNFYSGKLPRGQTAAIFTEVCPRLPKPCFNVINGGAHAGNELDFQEFMIVPQTKTFSKNLQIGVEIYQELKKIIKRKYGDLAVNVGDEGGFAPPCRTPEEVLDLILTALKNLNYQKEVKIILDVASSQFYQKGKYKTQMGVFSGRELLNYYLYLIKKYPILGLEDPFAEDDFEAWQTLIENCKLKIENFLIIGDDLLVTNPKRMKMAKEKNLCNVAIIKINQIGTLTGAIEAARLAKSYNWKIMVSHRSGETNDDFIADFSVGIGADFIKAGAPARGERVAKYNRLFKIEEDLKIS